MEESCYLCIIRRIPPLLLLELLQACPIALYRFGSAELAKFPHLTDDNESNTHDNRKYQNDNRPNSRARSHEAEQYV